MMILAAAFTDSVLPSVTPPRALPTGACVLLGAGTASSPSASWRWCVPDWTLSSRVWGHVFCCLCVLLSANGHCPSLCHWGLVDVGWFSWKVGLAAVPFSRMLFRIVFVR